MNGKITLNWTLTQDEKSEFSEERNLSVNNVWVCQRYLGKPGRPFLPPDKAWECVCTCGRCRSTISSGAAGTAPPCPGHEAVGKELWLLKSHSRAQDTAEGAPRAARQCWARPGRAVCAGLGCSRACRRTSLPRCRSAASAGTQGARLPPAQSAAKDSEYWQRAAALSQGSYLLARPNRFGVV